MPQGSPVSIPIGSSAYSRKSANEVEIRIINRFFEKNPTNQVDQTALIRRPGLRKILAAVGTGPIRRIHRPSASGWLGDTFVVSGTNLYRIHRTAVATFAVTQVAGVVAGVKTPSLVSTTDTLFVADGVALQYTNGVSALSAIATPDNIAPASIDYIAGFIIMAQVNSQRFYWIEPGDVTIDPLNFAEAERSPDPVLNVTAINDQFWLFGRDTTEVWYATGDFTTPFQRIEGRLFDRGIWEGTVVKVRDQVILTGADGVVYAVAGGPTPISTNGIEERIRRAIARDIQGAF